MVTIHTAQRQHCSCSLSTKHVKLKLIKQFPVTYIHKLECFHTISLMAITLKHTAQKAFDFVQATTGCLIVTEILQYMLNKT